MIIKSAHIEYRGLFCLASLCTEAISRPDGLHLTQDPAKLWTRKNGSSHRPQVCCISPIMETVPGLLTADSCRSLPEKAEVIQHILVMAGSVTGHGGTADLMVTDGALRRPRSCLLTGHKRYTRNTVIPRFCFSLSKCCLRVFFWMSEPLRSWLGGPKNQAGF